jgi:hypothetical protein
VKSLTALAAALLCLTFALPPVASAAEPKLQAVESVGYQINLGTRNRISLSRVGTVPLGAECVEFEFDPGVRATVLKDRMLVQLDAPPRRPNQIFVKCAPALPTPVCTAPKPAQDARIQTCPAGTVGTWSQTLDHVAASYPICWTPGQWTPAEAPAGICATPELRVYACADAGADGRILESTTGTIVSWPNCSAVSYQAPDKSLVVAVNPGTWPFYWRLASRLTSERLWTQKGGIGAWVRASAIDWGTPTLGSVPLSWPVPTSNCDGTPLTSLANYRILYGTNAGTLDRSIDVPAGVNKYTVDQLSPGTWYFAVKSLDSDGGDCGQTAVITKTIP